MDAWSAIGIFLVGAGAGALTTAAFYSAQIRELRRLLQITVSPESATEQRATVEVDEKRKSA